MVPGFTPFLIASLAVPVNLTFPAPGTLKVTFTFPFGRLFDDLTFT